MTDREALIERVAPIFAGVAHNQDDGVWVVTTVLDAIEQTHVIVPKQDAESYGHKIQWLLDNYVPKNGDGVFCFPDGEMWNYRGSDKDVVVPRDEIERCYELLSEMDMYDGSAYGYASVVTQKGRQQYEESFDILHRLLGKE